MRRDGDRPLSDLDAIDEAIRVVLSDGPATSGAIMAAAAERCPGDPYVGTTALRRLGAMRAAGEVGTRPQGMYELIGDREALLERRRRDWEALDAAVAGSADEAQLALRFEGRRLRDTPKRLLIAHRGTARTLLDAAEASLRERRSS